MEVSAKTTSRVESVKASWNEIMGRANTTRNHDVDVALSGAVPTPGPDIPHLVGGHAIE